ncbi:MAG: hypothetical protein COB37_09715 [Kordiimonadales bacterium]|nr:MAG: hypothetical protein COB37_09715 [Kordiimonadales bacterium]
MHKHFKTLIGLLFLGMLAYSGLWYTAAFDAQKKVTQQLADWRDGGLKVEYSDISHSGFPYRLNVDIAGLHINTRADGFVFSASSVTLISHLWTPGHWLAEARDAKGSFAGGSTAFSDDRLLGSYRLHDDGNIIIVVTTQTLGAFTLGKLMGRDGIALSTWQLSLRYSDAPKTGDTGLYGERFLDFKIAATTPGHSFSLTGGVSGPGINDWTEDALGTWRDEGGLLEIDVLDYSVPKGRTKGSFSLTLDEKFRPLGSANLTITGDHQLHALAKALGLKKFPKNLAAGPTSIMLQNGRLALNGEKASKLKPIVGKAGESLFSKVLDVISSN